MANGDTAIIVRPKGFYFEVKAGERYLWCACGRSANQPFCDGSHTGTSLQPVLFKADKNEDVIFCGCKQSGAKPFCDGTHNNLPGGYTEDDPDSVANRAVRHVAHGESPKVALDGACYLFSTLRAQMAAHGTMAYCRVLGPADGAQFQSQFYAEMEPGVSPVVSADGRDVILFVVEGEGDLDISGRPFAFSPRTGAYVGPGEAVRVHNRGPERVKMFVSAGPPAAELAWANTMPSFFDNRFPNRLIQIDPSQRHRMAERFFQMLINREHGAAEMTQFIGNIPRSKAAPHRHLYEEALIFLRGEGVVWTEHTKTEARAGDVLFLPRKQLHSVQCMSDGGLDVVGVISPGGNPSISY